MDGFPLGEPVRNNTHFIKKNGMSFYENRKKFRQNHISVINKTITELFYFGIFLVQKNEESLPLDSFVKISELTIKFSIRI